MISRKFIFVLSVACLFLGLNACKSKGSSNQTQVTTGDDNSKNSLDWSGTYSGILPCADCSGIETKLSLKSDNTYLLSWKYLEKNDEIYIQDGTFIWDSTGTVITLKDIDKEKNPTMYKVCENYLLQLDLEGNVVTGEIADKYILKKD